MTSVTNLRCEHIDNPMGIETIVPRLSWMLETDRRGARQAGYRIMVSSTADLLTAGTADLWDSGRVESDASVLITYAGKRLRSRQQCWWKVHVWDETGSESVSKPAYWEMGLLLPGDWKAKWITGSTPNKYRNVPASPIFRTMFGLKKPIASARAYVCGLGFHEFYLNNRKVGDAVLHPAFTKYDARVLYTVHDITEYLLQGENVAGVVTGTGWYRHHVQDAWDLHTASWNDECKALVQIEVTFKDNSKTTVLSNDSWLYSTGPIMFDGLRNGEIYDAREEKNDWNKVTDTSTDWHPVRIARHPGGVLHAQLMPPCRVLGTVHPVSVREVKPGVWIFDMGQNMVGCARLTISGPADTTIVMRYAERTGKDGDIDQSNISACVKSGDLQMDTYILKGNGVETFETRFAYHGFQYIQVTGLPGPATLNMVEGHVIHTDLRQNGSFKCSNELLNRIQKATLASTLGNYHGMPTDCPHREKNGWTGDAQLSAEQVLYNLEPASAYTKWMDDFSDCQRPSGALPGIVPTGGWGFNWGAGPAWDSAYINIPWYLYLYRGDLEILRRHYDGMKKYVDFLGTLATDHIVHFGLGDWCPPTPGPESHKAPAELTNTAYYYSDACIVAKIASLLGKKAEARRYETLAAKIKAAARKKYYDRKNGRLAGHSQTSIACFLYQGLTEPEEREMFCKMLLDEVAGAKDHIDCGILGAKYVLNTLTELGHADIAYRIVTQENYPSWGFWIKQGATTLWENWDGGSSRNHHMFSDISAWFYKTLAGILVDPERPGFKHVIIKPWPVGDLTSASGETTTPYGRVSSSWRKDSGRFVLEVSIPPNSTATVHVPAKDASSVLESGRPAKTAENVKFFKTEQGRAVYSVEAGSYRFESTY